MTISFINSFQSEWIKKKRSLASWLVLVGALFTPLIVLLARIKNANKLSVLYTADDFWTKTWHQSWESMSILILPIGIILGTGLITQLEYKNNAWKQLHTTPQWFVTIFFAKFLVLLVMLVEAFVLFNIGLYLSAAIPSWLFSNLPYPTASIPYSFFLTENIKFFIDCLPVLALQYLISLQFKNFLVPLGVGFIIWILSISITSWGYSFIFPYSHAPLHFLISSGHRTNQDIPVNIHGVAIAYFVVFMIAGYVLYAMKREKG